MMITDCMFHMRSAHLFVYHWQDVVLMGQALEKLFLTKIAQMPPSEEEIIPPIKGGKGRGKGKGRPAHLTSPGVGSAGQPANTSEKQMATPTVTQVQTFIVTFLPRISHHFQKHASFSVSLLLLNAERWCKGVFKYRYLMKLFFCVK